MTLPSYGDLLKENISLQLELISVYKRYYTLLDGANNFADYLLNRKKLPIGVSIKFVELVYEPHSLVKKQNLINGG